MTFFMDFSFPHSECTQIWNEHQSELVMWNIPVLQRCKHLVYNKMPLRAACLSKMEASGRFWKAAGTVCCKMLSCMYRKQEYGWNI